MASGGGGRTSGFIGMDSCGVAWCDAVAVGNSLDLTVEEKKNVHVLRRTSYINFRSDLIHKTRSS